MNSIPSPSDTTIVSPDITFHWFCLSYHVFLDACTAIEQSIAHNDLSQWKIHFLVAQHFIEAVNQILSCKPDGSYDDNYREKTSRGFYSQSMRNTPHIPIPYTHIEAAITQLAKFENQLNQEKSPLSIVVIGKIAHSGIYAKYNSEESKPFRKIPGLYPIFRLLHIVNGNFEINKWQKDIVFLQKIWVLCVRILWKIFVPYLDGDRLKTKDPDVQRLYSKTQNIIATFNSCKQRFPIEIIQTLSVSIFWDSESQWENGKKAEKNIKSWVNIIQNSWNREVQSLPKLNTFLSCAQSLGMKIKRADISRDVPNLSRELPYYIVYIRHPHAQTWCICDQVEYSVRVYDGIIDIAILANECSSSTVSNTDHAREIINWMGSDEHIRANITRVLRDGISHNVALRNHAINTLEGARNILEESSDILKEIGMIYGWDGKWDLSTMLWAVKSRKIKIGLWKNIVNFPNAWLNRERGIWNLRTWTLDHVGHVRDMLVSIGYQSWDIIVPKRYIKIT